MIEVSVTVNCFAGRCDKNVGVESQDILENPRQECRAVSFNSHSWARPLWDTR